MGLCTLIAWWWDWCLFFDECRHHKLIALSEGTSLVENQLTLLCQVQRLLQFIEELFGELGNALFPLAQS